MGRLLFVLWIALVVCLIAQDQVPLREEARDLENMVGVKKAIGAADISSPDFLAQEKPLRFLEACLKRYEQEVQGYSCIFRKTERIKGKLRPSEKIDVHFREQPFSVYFNWLDGADQAQKVVYVRGENNNKLLALPRGKLAVFFAGVVTRDVDGADAKNSGRYTIDQFGIYLGTKRTVESMRKAEEQGTLHLEYKGVLRIAQVGDRPCHIFVRKPYEPVEEEGLNELTIFIDQENWLQVGSVLKDLNGNLIAEYFFLDIRLNPEFRSDQFQRSILK